MDDGCNVGGNRGSHITSDAMGSRITKDGIACSVPHLREMGCSVPHLREMGWSVPHLRKMGSTSRGWEEDGTGRAKAKMG